MGHLQSSGGELTPPHITGASCRPNDAGEFSGDGEFERKREAGYLFDAVLPLVT